MLEPGSTPHATDTVCCALADGVAGLPKTPRLVWNVTVPGSTPHVSTALERVTTVHAWPGIGAVGVIAPGEMLSVPVRGVAVESTAVIVEPPPAAPEATAPPEGGVAGIVDGFAVMYMPYVGATRFRFTIAVAVAGPDEFTVTVTLHTLVAVIQLFALVPV